MEDIDGEIISNGIGALVKYLLNQPNNNIQIGLTTASFFRGDRCSLLTQAMDQRFERASLAYDEYLKSMEHLQSFSYDFLLCGHEYTNAIGILAKERKGKDIIYIPHPKSRHSTGDKYQEVKNIFTEYQKIHTGQLTDTSDGLTLLQSPNGDFKMLDLVDEDRRLEKKELLSSDDLKKQRETLDVIIALGMFKEGANWIWADRSIIVGVRDSLVDVVQMMGRLFRDAKNKRHVEVIQLLPFSLDQTSDSFRDNLNNYLKAIFASLILEDVFNSVKISVPFSTKTENDPEQEKATNKTTMSDLIPDESTRLSVIDDVIKHLVSISDTNNKRGEGLPALYEEYQSTLPEVLQEHGITTRIKEIGDKIWGMVLRRSLKMQGIAIEDIPFDIIKNTHPLEGLLRYTSGACGIETFTQLREAIRSFNDEKNTRWEFNYGLLVQYAKEHGNCRIPKGRDITVDGKVVKLGSWYNDQKKNFASLSLSKQESLRKLPGFIAKKFHRNKTLSIDAWTNLFIIASKKLGTPLIPNTHVEDGFNLGAWMQHIRKKEEWGKLTDEQKQHLLDNNFKLSPTKEWGEAAVLAMSQFAIREKTTIPKSGHNETIEHKGAIYSIGLSNLRKRIKMTPDEVDLTILEGMKKIPKFLEELHDDNEQDDNEYLVRGLEFYKKFNARTKQIIIPERQIEQGFDLFSWGKKIRARKNLENSFKDQVLSVDPYFFSTHPVRIFMQEVRPRLEAFIVENKNALIPQGYVCSDKYPLGEKVADLRERRTKLAEPITKYLNSLGEQWAWNSFEHTHLQTMKELIAYIESNGYQKEALPKEVRELISKIKKTLSKYPSSESYQKRIESLAPGIFDEPKDENYLALLNYAAREGHACPPIKHIEDGKKIGLHVSNIRQKYKNELMTVGEQERYKSLKGWR